MSGDHVAANRASWDADADNWVDRGRKLWADPEISWGIWNVPESQLGLLPDVAGLDVVELGCGTGYVSGWLARRGALPVGLDTSSRQLATARRFQREFGVGFPLVHADAERPPLRTASFDLAVSEYGAPIWCDPYRWIPEAARLLRPDGRLVFLRDSILAILTFPEEDLPATDRLQRPQFGMHRFEWPEAEGAVEFAIPHGEMIRVLRASGFEVEDVVTYPAPEDASTPTRPLATAEWSRRWPIEEVWKARRRRGDEIDPVELFGEHARRFNEAVRGGDFRTMVAEFDTDAELVFEGVPVGPFRGRDAIAEAYASQPPDDEVVVLGEPVVTGDTVAAPFGWTAAPDTVAGEMRMTLRGDRITRLTVTFAA
jgi:SAM-dependent methyltransferase